MKLFCAYLKQRRRTFAIILLFCLVFAINFSLYRLPIEAIFYPALLCAVIGVVYCTFDFHRLRREHTVLTQIHSITDAMIAAFPHSSTIADEDYQRIIQLICEEHRTFQSKPAHRYSDLIDYYTVWAHQIKTPISAMRLRLQNEDSTFARSLLADLYRIEQYVEMVLTFLRLDSQSTDYLIREYDPDPIIRAAVKKFSSEFIDRKLRLNYTPQHITVLTDEKWLSFVIEQVLSNALKYTRSGSIAISFVNEKTLQIRDTGIGIAPEDLPRIFENGYTGYNGRVDKSASGIGLYLCKRICSNLGHTISAQSVLGEGTTVKIDLNRETFRME